MIFLDNFFSYFVDQDQAIVYNHIDEIPYGADVVGKAFYNCDFEAHREVIKNLLPKTKKLILMFVEIVDPKIVEFIQEFTDPRVVIIINAVADISVESAIAWFVCPNNFYNKSSGNQHVLPLVDKLTHSQHKLKYFDCLLGRQKYHRTQIENFYQASKHQDKIIFSYFKSESDLTAGIWDIDVSLIPNTATSIDEYNVPLSSILPVSIYNQSYYSIVAETTYSNTYNQYTEKIAKPIIAQRLFVAFSGKNYLANLRKLGFKTFGSIIDESYDNVDNLNTRLKLAWDQVEWLCNQDPVHVLKEIQPIVEHNYNHFNTTDWMSNIRAHF